MKRADARLRKAMAAAAWLAVGCLSAPDSALALTGNISVPAGKPTVIYTAGALNRDCTSPGVPTVQIVQPPTAGSVKVAQSLVHPGFAAWNARASCNGGKAPAMVVTYTGKTAGTTDAVSLEIIGVAGGLTRRTIRITVK